MELYCQLPTSRKIWEKSRFFILDFEKHKDVLLVAYIDQI